MIPVDTKPKFDIKTAFTLVVGQASLIAVATGIAALLGTPNYGLGPSIDLSPVAIRDGILWTAPLGVSALLLDKVEEQLPILKEVTKATQASVLGFMGGSFQPVLGLITAAGLGVAAGLGEEMLFRGVMQYELTSRVGDGLALVATSVVFGALHAVTPLYAMLASLASVFFGWLYLSTGNLVIAISCHAFYDLVALMYAHWQVSHMTAEEQEDLLNWPRKGNEVL
jgi:membrane protease YdiL (CAAX protease family)